MPVTVSSKSELGQGNRTGDQVHPHFGTNKTVFVVVERPRQAPGGPFSILEEPRPSVVIRRVGLSMGSNTREIKSRAPGPESRRS